MSATNYALSNEEPGVYRPNVEKPDEEQSAYDRLRSQEMEKIDSAGIATNYSDQVDDATDSLQNGTGVDLGRVEDPLFNINAKEVIQEATAAIDNITAGADDATVAIQNVYADFFDGMTSGLADTFEWTGQAIGDVGDALGIDLGGGKAPDPNAVVSMVKERITEINVGDGDDVVYGAGFGDTIFGGTGSDVLLSGSGDDAVFGEYGDDTLNGGGGNDFLDGGMGHDHLIGGDGDDVLTDVEYAYRGYNGGDDILDGGAGNDIVSGGSGDDKVYGGAGDDIVKGGAGDDIVRGNEGADTLYGGAGKDNLHGGSGDDILAGGEGDDALNGGVGNDYLDGGEGDDVLFGGDGHDILVSNSGNDVLDGGSGSDIFILGSSSGATVTLNDDEGADTLDLSAWRGGWGTLEVTRTDDGFTFTHEQTGQSVEWKGAGGDDRVVMDNWKGNEQSVSMNELADLLDSEGDTVEFHGNRHNEVFVRETTIGEQTGAEKVESDEFGPL